MKLNTTNILIVDDDPVTCSLIKRVLSKQNDTFRCRIRTEQNLSGAIRRLREEPFDNVLLDLGLPDSSGPSTVEKVHLNAPDIPIVVLTGQDDKAVELEARKVGADDYLVKGTTIWENLIKHIRFAIEQKKINADLRSKGHFYQSIVTHMSNPVFYLTEQGVILETNAAAEKKFGSDATNPSIEKAFTDLFPLSIDKYRITKFLEQARKEPQQQLLQTTCMDTEGQMCLFNWDILYTANKDNGSIAQITAVAWRMSEIPSNQKNDEPVTPLPIQELPSIKNDNATQATTGRVLIVQNDSVNQVVLSSALTDMGLVTVQIHSNSDLLKIKPHTFDLILVNADPEPALTGILKQLRQRDITKPIIAMTRNDIKPDPLCKTLFDDILYQPLSRKMLYNCLSRYIDIPVSASPIQDRKRAKRTAANLNVVSGPQNYKQAMQRVQQSLKTIKSMIYQNEQLPRQTNPEQLKHTAATLGLSTEHHELPEDVVMQIVAHSQIELMKSSLNKLAELGQAYSENCKKTERSV